MCIVKVKLKKTPSVSMVFTEICHFCGHSALIALGEPILNRFLNYNLGLKPSTVPLGVTEACHDTESLRCLHQCVGWT